MSGTNVCNIVTTAARQIPVSNHDHDNSELGESTPIVFAPGYPTQKDPLDWPQLLADCRQRLISAWRETIERPRGTQSLPGPDTAEPSSAVTGDQAMGSVQTSNNSGLPKRDLHHGSHAVHVTPNLTSIQHARAGDLHDTSADHCPGDPEMPQTSTASEDAGKVYHKVLTDTDNCSGHSDRQSPTPLTTLPTQPGSPPDEDVMPKRVADGRRSHLYNDNNMMYQLLQSNQDFETSHTRVTFTRTATVSNNVSQPIPQTPSLNSRHRTGRDNSNLGSLSMAPEGTMDNPTSQPAITSIALALNTLSLRNDNIATTTVLPINNNTTLPINNNTTLQMKNLNSHLQKLVYKLYHTRTHETRIVHSIPLHPSIRKFSPMLTTTAVTVSPSEIDAHIQLAIAPLIQCVHRHYDKLVNDIHKQMLDHLVNTYQTMSTHKPDDRNQTLIMTQVKLLFHELQQQTPPTVSDHTTTNMVDEDDDINNNNSNSSPMSEPNRNPSDYIDETDTTIESTPSERELTRSTTVDKSPPKHNRQSYRTRKKIMMQNHTPDNCVNPNCYSCAVDNIVNLSNIQLSKAQTMVLSKGLSFVPTADNATPMEIIKDFNIFTNKANRKLIRMKNPPRVPRPSEEPVLVRRPRQENNNTITIIGPSMALEEAFEEARLEINEIEPNPTNKHNLTRNERIALKELTTNPHLVINKADKGSTIVVRHRDDYIREGLEHLSDINTYQELDKDYTFDITRIVNRTLNEFKTKGLLSPKMADYCFPPRTPRTSQIYFLTKIHKNPMSVRPIVSTIDSPTANMAEFLDHYLQPIMRQLPAYLKDTTQFLNELANIKIQHDTWLVTVDVKSLYTNIPNNEGIQACYEAWLEQELGDPQHPPAEVLRYLLEMVLKLNTFEFNQKYYLQQFGTAMGSKLAPAYANTFMGKLEKSILDSSPLKPTYYRRFIDDIFMIWPHSEKDLNDFITHMNAANNSIKFTHEYSQQEVVFLDVVVHKKTGHHEGDTLQTRTHIKPTNKQLYVRNDSYHPPGTGKGVTIGEAIRYLRTNSDPEQFSKMIHKHKKNLAKRGYNMSQTGRQLKRIKFSMRANRALNKCNNNNKKATTPLETSKPTFVTRYCPNAQKAFRVLLKHWTSVYNSTGIPILKRFLKCTPRMAYKANPNLAKKLVRAKLKPIQTEAPTTTVVDPQQTDNANNIVNILHAANLEYSDVSNQPPDSRDTVTLCHNSKCPLHNRLINSSQVRSKISRRTYNTHGQVTCDTPYIVYLIQCRRCGKQYVGQTQKSLKARYAKHLRNIKDKHSNGVLQDHFRKNVCGDVDNITMQLLHRVIPQDHQTQAQIEETLKRIETLWMDRLMCVFPQGLNWLRYDATTRQLK